MTRPHPVWRPLCRLLALILLVLFLAAGGGLAGPPEIQWIGGPATMDLEDVAQITLGKPYLFLNRGDTKKLLEEMGNPTSGTEVGLVTPRAEDQEWFIVFEYHPVGYVRDDEKDQIDPAAILETIRQGTEESNAVRKARGFPALHVIGWLEEPHYDPVSHNLVWATVGKNDDGEQSVNYNVRLLGRQGYISAILVDDPEGFAASKPEVEKILSQFSYRKGKSYAEYVSGDKIATYGLVALVAGGAAVKLGFFQMVGKVLAKSWKIVVVAFVGLGVAFRRLLHKIFGRHDRRLASSGTGLGRS